METVRAIDVAKWFIRNDLDSPRDTFDGNMKLQKLLYFAQLIHFAKNNELLFSDEMKAYENGTVINNVRLNYKQKVQQLVSEAEKFNSFEDSKIEETLNLTHKIFGDMSANELSELNHELMSWKVPFHESLTETPGVYKMNLNTIEPSGKLFLEDVNRVKEMLEAYSENESFMDYEVINGVTFYYDSNEVSLTDDIVSFLERINCPEDVYTLTIDDEQGIIIS